MFTLVQIVFFTLAGILLLLFAYTLFFAVPGASVFPVLRGRRRSLLPDIEAGAIPSQAGGPVRFCPVCNGALENGERVRSAAFPSRAGERDRLMHIAGCGYCLAGQRARVCPVCKAELNVDEILVARLFDKPGRSHVHVIGCSRCKKTPGTTAREKK
jgi:hypothetical protein